jgi:CRISPR-associated endonuclease/helicase Cas3
MTRIENKSARLTQIEALLLAHPQGLTKAELARRLGVHRSTISRNLLDISAPVSEENGRLIIDRECYLVNLRLNLHEALAIHLAGRLMTTRLDRQNPHAAAAFRKLGIALEKLACQISRFVRSSANTFDNETKLQDPRYLQVLEKLTVAWAKGQKVMLWYRKTENGEIKQYTFCPYFIEAGAVGQAIYSIGRIEPANELRTFKIERVERIEPTSESFTPPDDFDPEKMFSLAWGIWYTEQEPVEVILRFSPRVAARVKETRWHPTEQVVPAEDGGLIWRAFIAEPREMMPWVRSWGSDAEVLEPENVREEIAEEARKMMEMYR